MTFDDFTYDPNEFRWPTETRKVFARGGSALKPDTMTRVETHYRFAYFEAIKALRSYSETDRKGDMIGLPLAFLWRHLIESMMKDVIRRGRELFFEDLTKDEERALGTHNLATIWRLARDNHVAPLGDPAGPECKATDAFVAEIQSVDPGADGFRYPFTRKGEVSLESAPSGVDVGHMHDTFLGIYNFLDGCLSEISAREDFFSEYESEMAREYGWPDREALGANRRAYAEHRYTTAEESADP